MFHSYLKIWYRLLKKNISFSLINLIGLSIGLTCLILISIFIQDQFSYDRFHKNAERIKLIGVDIPWGDGLRTGINTPPPLGPTLAEELPELDNYTTLTKNNNLRISTDGETYQAIENVILSEDTFFETFTFDFVAGNPATALSNRESVVISRKLASQLYPNENPIGKPLYIKNLGDSLFTVTGVAQTENLNSYVDFSIVAPIYTIGNYVNNETQWGAYVLNSFITVSNSISNSELDTKINSITDKYQVSEQKARYFTINMQDIYLSDHVNSNGFKGSIRYIYIFSSIAFLILFLACVNYINLSVARSTSRTKEVGLKKVLGVERSQLVIQFLGESVIMTNMAFVFAILFSIQLLPAFNNFMNLELSLSIIESWDTILMLYLVSVLIGFITGSYPAFVISRFSTIDSLKNTANKKIGNVSFQKALVTFQIAISSFLILSSSIIYSQLSFLANKDLGIQEDQVLYIPGWYLGTQIDAFKAQLSSLSSVEFVSMSSQVPPYIGSSTGRQWDPNNEDSEFYATVLMTDSDFMDAMGFELIAGRYFDEEKFPSDIEKGMLINKTMLDRLGWGEPENAIGYLYPDSVKIIGVVDDFHYSSLKNEIKPLYIRNRTYPNVFNYVSLRFNPAQVEQLISDTHEIWNSFETGEPFNYYFVDDRFEQLFETETKLKNALFVFTLIALFIAGLGLYGLALFTVKKRFKEIGIRKVLGASAQNILLLLLKEYILYTCIGFLICIPLAYYTMSLWLEDFAYRIDIPTYIFILTFTLILLISITTVLIEAYKAVIANPTISLKEQ